MANSPNPVLKTALVTGAGNGIGRGVAHAYAAAGYRVVVVDLDGTRAENTLAEIRQAHPEIGAASLAVQVDVRRPEEITALFSNVRETCGRLDVLINNAGISRWKSPYELTVDEWDDVLHTNLRSAFLCAREAAKLMKEQEGGGKIVNMASTRALQSEPNTEAYAASKGGLLALTHALAVSLGPDSIHVNCISPGWIQTADYDQLRLEDHTQHPSGRVGTPDDIARACLFLTDERNDFITGVNLVVDGGMTRKMIYLED
ncbi:SDR family NAD(P)-dependent oxidoreductase [Tumebacillus flagellatus]|uniref:3-ketoacyl-ACP reductase n=1 Tax=Tumebacillus flagellatus TaxID=1157490 RepID=A0A074LU83_9BACL|nr:glucose 1-dehydrogenase [Tumebacillus flagellatus]KEO83483.1 3-ketoacyl-ACP reductase [Tumebacillus flagellatus]